MDFSPPDHAAFGDGVGWLLLRHAATAGPAGCFVGRSDRAIAGVDANELRVVVDAVGKVDVAVVTSLRRTSETLDLLVRAGLPAPLRVVVAPGLIEQSFGRWEEQSYDDLAKVDPAYWPFWDDPVSHVPPGGESYLRLWRRSVETYQALSRAQAGRVLHVGHAGPIRALTQAVPPLSLHRMQTA
jgi:broad specificity phosphatase PhoE